MNEKQQSIMIALLGSEKSSFRALQEKTKTSPRILRKHLDQMVKQDLLKEDVDTSWKREVNNRPHRISLTDKGIKNALKAKHQLSSDLINRGLEILEGTTAGLDSEKVATAIKEETEALWNTKINKKEPQNLPKLVSEFALEASALERRKLLSAIYRLHVILTNYRKPSAQHNQFITVIKGDEPWTIPSSYLEGIDFWLLWVLDQHYSNGRLIKRIKWTPDWPQVADTNQDGDILLKRIKDTSDAAKLDE